MRDDGWESGRIFAVGERGHLITWNTMKKAFV